MHWLSSTSWTANWWVSRSFLDYFFSITQYFLQLVAGSAIQAFEEVCPERIDLIHKNYRKLCNLLVDVEEWGQVVIIQMLTRYCRTQFVNPNQDVSELGQYGSIYFFRTGTSWTGAELVQISDRYRYRHRYNRSRTVPVPPLVRRRSPRSISFSPNFRYLFSPAALSHTTVEE